VFKRGDCEREKPFWVGGEGEVINRGFKGDEVPLYLKGWRVGKDKIRGGVDASYDIIKLSLIMEANYWKH
jgi:hypothetical protein